MEQRISAKRDLTHYFKVLQGQIEQAQKNNLPIDIYVKKQIAILQKAHDEFISSVRQQGRDISDPNIGEIEIQQYAVMRDLANKIGLSTKKYEKLIKDVQIRILGEENYKRFFEQK